MTETFPVLCYDQQARHDFALLPFDQQQVAVRRLAASGAGDHTIAQATGLSTEMVRRLIAEREAQP